MSNTLVQTLFAQEWRLVSFYWWQIAWTAPVWYSSILEFRSMKLNLTLLPQSLCAIYTALVVHTSVVWVRGGRCPEFWTVHTKTLVYSIRVSQGSVATRSWCGGIFNDGSIANFSHRLCQWKRMKIHWELTTLSIWALPYLRGGQVVTPAQRWGRISSAQCATPM